MPSDCRCSSACLTEVRTVVKKIIVGSKEATELIEKLEDEIKELKIKCRRLKDKLECESKRLTKASISKSQMIEALKKKLDNI